MIASLPNALSILRIFLSFILIGVYSGENRGRYICGLVIIALALATDFLDGYLARRWAVTSELGYILDGLGDRAAYVALILTFVAHDGVNLVVAWLLIFREIAIYAFRLLNRGWYASSSLTRRFSRWHAAGIRAWFSTYLLVDGAALAYGFDLRGKLIIAISQSVLVAATIGCSYYGLYRMLNIFLNAPVTPSLPAEEGDWSQSAMEREAKA